MRLHREKIIDLRMMIWAVKEHVSSHGAFEEYQVDDSGSKVKGHCRDAKSVLVRNLGKQVVRNLSSLPRGLDTCYRRKAFLGRFSSNINRALF